MGHWWRSFRWRLALLASTLIAVIFLGFATLVGLRLNRAMNAQHEARLRFLVERLPPLPFLLREYEGGTEAPWHAPGMGRGHERLRELIGERNWVAFSPSGEDAGWYPFVGDWPEAVKEALKRRQAGDEWAELPVFARSLVQRRLPGPGRWEAGGPPPAPGTPESRPPPPPAPRAPQASAEAAQALHFFRLAEEEAEWYVAGLKLPEGTLWLVQDTEAERGLLRAARRILLTLLPLILVVVVACSYFIATRALRPVRKLTVAMSEVSERTLGTRLSTEQVAAEFEGLIDRFNDMLERLERSFAQASRFSADAAHELKTPLTILQGELEEAVQAAADSSLEQERFVSLLEEVTRLRLIAERLLQLAKADSGRLIGERRRERLDTIVAEEGEAMAETAEGLEWSRTLEPVEAEVDEPLFRQAVRNLLVNAVKYNRPGGSVEVALEQIDGHVCLRITNTGAPIPEAEQATIFDRFTRVDASRHRGVEGLGLGLSLAREIARAHGGDLVLERSDEKGTEFVLELPPYSKLEK